MEVKVIEPMFHQGKPVQPGEVIDLPAADATYLVNIKRVEAIKAEAGAGKVNAKTRTNDKAKAKVEAKEGSE